jgi:hypothetical protein
LLSLGNFACDCRSERGEEAPKNKRPRQIQIYSTALDCPVRLQLVETNLQERKAASEQDKQPALVDFVPDGGTVRSGLAAVGDLLNRCRLVGIGPDSR